MEFQSQMPILCLGIAAATTSCDAPPAASSSSTPLAAATTSCDAPVANNSSSTTSAVPLAGMATATHGQNLAGKEVREDAATQDEGEANSYISVKSRIMTIIIIKVI